MLNFNRDELKRETDIGSFQRGLTYFNEGFVIEQDIILTSINKIILSSEVSGNSFYNYNQEITLSRHHQNFTLDGECTCPVGHNCKHVIASCLEYLATTHSNEPESTTNNSLNWLNDFVLAGAEDNIPQNEFICYVLKPTKMTGEISVNFIKHRRLKSGNFGKGKHLTLYGISDNYGLPNYLNDIDIEIGKMIEAQNEQSWNSNILLLSAELGHVCLIKIINTGRAYWQNVENPILKKSDSRDVNFHWQDIKNDGKQLMIEISPAAMPLNLYPALYLDTATHEVGEIKGANFSLQQWKMLLSMPFIPTETCIAFSKQLHINLPNATLPLPEELNTREIDLPATPHLLVFDQIDSLTGHHSHFLRLRHRYDMYEVPAYPRRETYNLSDDDTFITIKRNIDTEKASLVILEDLGLNSHPDATLTDTQFYFSSATGIRSEILESWEIFLQESLPSLEEMGWIVEIDPSFELIFLEVDDWNVEIESNNDWFDLRFDIEINGEKIPLLPLITQTLNNYDIDNLPKDIILPLSTDISNSQYVKLPTHRIQPIIQTLYELFDRKSNEQDNTLRLSRFDAARLAELEDSCSNELNWTGGKAMRQLGRKLKNFNGIKKVAPPRGLKATLRDYQQQGFNWLQFLREYNFNGILADDMGLGKTVQTLAMLLKEKERKRLTKPCLILAPTSLMSNWRREAEIFTPKLSVLTLQGANRKQHFDEIENHDIILSTYPLLVRDKEILLSHEYHYLILDEAQIIKNPRAKAARVARDITTQHRLCLTGTPMENHLGELWALFDFLMPGCLGNQKSFNQAFRKPIEKHNDIEQRQRLVNRIAPFMLRRTKSEVVLELPDKTEIIRSVSLGKAQAALYESIRLSMEKKVRNAIKQKGLSRSHITILDALLKLRQTCCDPKLLSLAQAAKVKSSA
ncbi:DNA/RNA helicases, SNF2 family, partial [hydrothermal vent metagenome]